MPRHSRSTVSVIGFSVLGTVAGLVLLAGGAAALPKKYSPYHKLNVFTRVLSYVKNNYVEDRRSIPTPASSSPTSIGR